MKPIGLNSLQATTVHDGVREVIVVLALDHRGNLWRRIAEPGAAWHNMDEAVNDARQDA